MPEIDQRLTFAELARLEPALSQLLAKVRAERAKAKADVHYCANDNWYRFFKPRLCRLVGWERPDKHRVLSSTEAYDVAYDALYEFMPFCRACGCL
jgi:hypothetical protein